MRARNLSILTLALLALSGCGSMSLENKRVDYKAAVAKVPSLEVPPDLTAPVSEDHYAIPEAGGESAASYSDYAKGGLTPRARVAATTVLPEIKNVRMQRSGVQRWLEVNDKAENIWPVIKAFWQENGFVIKTENPQAGMMETDWAENRSKIPKTGLRSFLGKVADGLYDSGERDMFRVRLEHGKADNSTEIYMTHYGIEEVLSVDKSISKWQQRANDPDLEATMLQLLTVKLGGAEAGAQEVAQPVAPKLQTQADGKQLILLPEPFDKSWRKVGLALERAGFVMEDRDRNSGLYFLRVEEPVKEKGLLDKLSFWRKDEAAKPLRYQVAVREVGNGCEVTISDPETGGKSTQRIVDELYKALTK
ncbi:MAG: outer membrane protein assembly factor BamC [Nitrosomonadales bacterium]|nr:outer membrane protein assembly factor BamC [Nitrosomonadales bacterium]